MSQDALERLRNKAKPTVTNRELPTSTLNETNHQTNTDVFNSNSQDIEISTLSEFESENIDSTKAESELPSVELETKQSTIRLEKGLSQRMTSYCQQEEISREVFLEALFVQFEKNKALQSKVLKEARQRDEKRRKIANYRRAKSMIEKFGNID
jgi:hypothetical protein